MLLKVAAWFDPPEVLDASAFPIPGSGSAPYQVIAVCPALITQIDFTDTTLRFIGLFVGPVGQEVRATIVGGKAGSSVHCLIPPGARISVRNTEPDTITQGVLMCQFLTPVPEGSGPGQFRL